MAQKKCDRSRFTFKKISNAVPSADSHQSLSRDSNPTLSDIRSPKPKKKLQAKNPRGGKKNAWSPSHYVPTSFTLSLNSLSPNKQSSRVTYRWPSKSAGAEKEKSMSFFKLNDSNKFKDHARGVFHKLFSSAPKAPLPTKPKPIRRSLSSSWRQKSKNASDDPFSATKPRISYPMKLHNSELSFVTTQDPWEASVRSSSLRRRATLGTTRSQNRSISCSEVPLSCCPTPTGNKRLSFNVQNRVSNNSMPDPTLKLRPEAVNSLRRSTCTDRPKSANQLKLSFDETNSKRSQNQSFPPNRGSLYRHPSTRPLSLSNHSRRNSVLWSGDESTKKSNLDANSRRSSMVSSNLTSTTNPQRQSWATGRTVLESSIPQGSGLSANSERSSVHSLGIDRKSISNYRLPAVNNWAGTIEEDITVTLMGCPQGSSPSKRSSAVIAPSTPPSPDTSSKSPSIAPPPTRRFSEVDIPCKPPFAEPVATLPSIPTLPISRSSAANPASQIPSAEPVATLPFIATPPTNSSSAANPASQVASPNTSTASLSIATPPTSRSSEVIRAAPQISSVDTLSASPSIPTSQTKRSSKAIPSSKPPSADTSSISLSIATPPTPTPPISSLNLITTASSTPSPPLSVRRISDEKLHQPLPLLLPPIISCPQIGELNNDEKRRSDWYADLMTSIEQSISNID